MLMRYLALMHYVVSQTDRQMDSQTSDTTIPKAAAGPQTKGGHLLYDKDDRVTSQVFRHTQDGGGTGIKEELISTINPF